MTGIPLPPGVEWTDDVVDHLHWQRGPLPLNTTVRLRGVPVAEPPLTDYWHRPDVGPDWHEHERPDEPSLLHEHRGGAAAHSMSAHPQAVLLLDEPQPTGPGPNVALSESQSALRDVLGAADCNCEPGDPTCEDWHNRSHRLTALAVALDRALRRGQLAEHFTPVTEPIPTTGPGWHTRRYDPAAETEQGVRDVDRPYVGGLVPPTPSIERLRAGLLRLLADVDDPA